MAKRIPTLPAVLAAFSLLAAASTVSTDLALAAEPAAHGAERPAPQRWSFAGAFGKFDTAQLQRGFQVYKEVCSFCHSLKLVAYRNLGEDGGPSFSADAVKALAAQAEVTDGPNAAGAMFTRPGRPSDHFVPPFANDEAAAANNNGAAPPDLSLIAKSRGSERGFPQFLFDFFLPYQEGGPDYVHALLTGYREAPAGQAVPPGLSYNPIFPAKAIAMAPPLSAGGVTYTDGTPETVDQYARDVAAFLMWTAEPHLVERKRIGFQALIFLMVFAGLMYLAKRRVWAGVPH